MYIFLVINFLLIVFVLFYRPDDVAPFSNEIYCWDVLSHGLRRVEEREVETIKQLKFL